jgi:TP901 family phage tail tape measure protein
MAVTTGRIFAINLLANSKPAEDAFSRVGQAAGRLPTPMKVAAAALTAVFAAVTTVAVRSFKSLLELGAEFNEVTRIIRVGTGAVGGDLAALEQSFRNVATSVPNSFADVASVIAELDTRTDLAGDGLEAMAEQLLTLSRLMGGDVKATTREVTRLFNRFGLSAEESSDMLDLLFRASQASGASVDKLATDVTKNAGALIAMGLSLEQSVALFALFEREGVRAETVVRSLRSGFQKLSADGRPLQESLAEVFAELQTLDREAAVAKGLEIFGAQALELVDAVRDGRLSVEDFTKQLVDGNETIVGVAEDTDGWREKLAELRNFLKLQFEPVAREVFANVTKFVDELKPAADRIVQAFERDGLQGALAQVAEEWDKIYREQLQPLFRDRFVPFLNDTVKPLIIETGIAIGKDFARAIWNAFKNWFEENWAKLARELFSRLTPAGLATDLFQNVVVPRLPEFDYSGPIGQQSPSVPSAPRPSSSSAPGGSGVTGRVPVPQVPQVPGGLFVPFADGGIVSSPTLGLVGEAGPEAIVPLDRAGRLGGTSIVVNVSGAVDPEGTARQIRRILQDAERRSGVRVLS